MQFPDILKRCVGETVIINNSEERQVLGVEDDFVILQGGNPQMKITEFIHFSQIVKVIRADYASTGEHSISFDLTTSYGDQRRSSAH